MKKNKNLSWALALAMSLSIMPNALAEETATAEETTDHKGYVYDFEDYEVGRLLEGNNQRGIFTMSYNNWPPLNQGTSKVDGSYIDVDPLTGNKAVRITENKAGQILRFNLPESVESKYVDVSFDFRMESLTEVVDEATGDVTYVREPSYRYITQFARVVDADGDAVANTFTYQNYLKATEQGSIHDFAAANPEKYYNMKYTLDFEKGTYDVYVDNVKKASGLTISGDDISKMIFNVSRSYDASSAQNNTTNLWIDNFKVLPRDNSNITFEDYEEGESISLIDISVQSGNTIGIAKDGDNTALKVVQTNGSSTSFDVKLPKSEGGIYRVSFDTKFVTPLKRFYPFAEIYGGEDKISYSYGGGRTIKYGNSNTSILNTETCDQTKYYNFDIIVDFDKQEYSMYLDGVKKVTSPFTTTSKRVEYLDKLTFKIDGWTTENNSESSRPGTATYWFDNFEIKECIYPEIQEVFPPENSENISIENKEISVRFNCPVSAESINSENVILYKNGEIVSEEKYGAVSMGENIKITFKENLDYASEYKVELKTGIAMDSESGRKLLEDYSFSFVTQPKPIRIKTVKLIDMANNKEVSAITDVTGDKVKVSCVLVNEYDEAKTYSVIAGIYSEDNMMVDTGVSVGSIESKSELTFDYELDASDGKILKVFLWNGFGIEAIELDDTIKR